MDKTLFQKYLVRLLVKILPVIINNISPAIRQYIVTLVLELEVKAQETENEFDDFLVDVLKLVLDID